MQSTSWSSSLSALSAEQRQQLLDSPELETLPMVFATIPDPRSRHGLRYPLPFLLTCLVTAVLCQCNSLDAVGQWCAEHRALLRRRFPDQRHHTPTGSLFRRLLPRLSAEQLEWRLAGWMQHQDRMATGEALALDGKTVHGSDAAGGTPIHLLSISTHDSGHTLCQVAVGEKTNEIPVAQALVRLFSLPDRIWTADALHTHRDLCQLIRDGGGHYLLIVKENEPRLHQALTWYFDDPGSADRCASTRERHRGRIEERCIQVTDELTAYLADWPGIQQQAKLTRTVSRKGQRQEETVYLITSLLVEDAGPERLLTLARGQWSIEMV